MLLWPWEGRLLEQRVTRSCRKPGSSRLPSIGALINTLSAEASRQGTASQNWALRVRAVTGGSLGTWLPGCLAGGGHRSLKVALTGASPVTPRGCQDLQANEVRTTGHGAEQGLTRRAPAGQCGSFRPAVPPDVPVSECGAPSTPAHPRAGSALGCPAVTCVGHAVRTVELLVRPVECASSPNSC